MFLTSTVNVFAVATSNYYENATNESVILKGVTERLENIKENAIEYKELFCDYNEEFTYYIGDPYIMYQVEAETQDEVIYYPIVCEELNKVEFTVDVARICDDYTYNLSGGYVEILNEIGYVDNDMISYVYNGIVFFETEYRCIDSYDFYVEGKVDEAPAWDIPFKNKIEQIENVKFNSCNKPDSFSGIEENARYYGSLTLKNPRGQYSYGMCWACSVATVYNYLKTTPITGFDVCNAMGIGYYGINYSHIRNSSLTYSQIQSNINNSKPFIINGLYNGTSGSGHAVTGYGYISSGSSAEVKIWDSALNGGTGAYSSFIPSNAYFTSNGVNFYWVTTLSYY